MAQNIWLDCKLGYRLLKLLAWLKDKRLSVSVTPKTYANAGVITLRKIRSEQGVEHVWCSY